MSPYEYQLDPDPEPSDEPLWQEGYEAAQDDLQPQIDRLSEELAIAKEDVIETQRHLDAAKVEIERLTKQLWAAGLIEAA